MGNYLDLTPYRRATVGFERLFDRLDAQMRGNVTETHPAFDIRRDDEDRYRIILAVPGFSPDQIDITIHQNQLTVSGQPQPEADAGNYLHRGIVAGAFERQFQLSDFMEIGDATLENGLLTIPLQRVVPEHLQPRRISIGNPMQEPRRNEVPQEAA
jgi:molecular chaperone IbpA